MSIAHKIIAIFSVILFALPAASFAQASCDPAYTALDYHLYALDAALDEEFDTAYELYDCWMETFPTDVDAYLDRAAVRTLDEDYEGALADLDQVDSFTDSSIATLRRAFVQLAMGDYQQVIDTMPAFRDSLSFRLPEIDEVLSLAYRERGIARVDAGQYDAALDDLMLAYANVSNDELTTEDVPAVKAIAIAFEMTGDYENTAGAYTLYVNLAGDEADPEIVALVEQIEDVGLEAFSDR